MALEEMRQLVEGVVDKARTGGAETAEAILKDGTEFSVIVREGKIEQLTESRSSRLLIILSRDRRLATVSTSDLSPERIDQLITEGIELAGVMDRDDYFGLPDRDQLGRIEEDLGIFDPETCAFPTDRKIAMAMELERAALEADGRIITDGASFSNEIKSIAFANSLGFCDGHTRTLNSIEIACAAQDTGGPGGNTGKKQSSYWYSIATHLDRLEPIEDVAARAVSRTLRKLGARKPETCEVPVIFDPLMAARFIESIAKAAGGGNIYRKSSFLVDKRGQRVASKLVTFIDDPLLAGGLASRPFDGEGVKSRRTVVIENGTLQNYLMDSYQARKLGLATTGNSGGNSNFYMVPGRSTPGEIIAGVTEGLYLTNLFGPGADWSTGDFSQGGQGIWIENGELSYPVNEFTIAGSFPQILEGIVMIGNDLSWRSEYAGPTFLVERMTISGT